eukprot:CAMPEP_0185581802 /NCGR_PEP_ID=MMETSP0434-20130131/19030_1 /TAXON_ID=626734 ORGANISM="Favella taraikaensis, Strain Fe Narragansett Bay" /NCGR_SAMPLE_ID=MMETSP0434 /ASSEMBLY_ACC=CAM_ASM_000379 /LENGTH=69 /DNA_ID=CAMNT_0028200431 /DNA_START=601 /DNA_END=810 /DNA_ORIENTATION=+
MSTLTGEASMSQMGKGGTFDGVIGAYYRSQGGSVASIDGSLQVKWDESSGAAALSLIAATAAALATLSF